MSARIFINYRRGDTAGHAGRLHERLSKRFGRDHVFMDLNMAPGIDFVDRIDQAVASCAVLVTLIGSEWLTATDAEGKRRLDDPSDFVRLEIASALERGVQVIPVLVEDVEMPNADQLPEPLAPLARRNAIELSDARWGYDAGRLIKALEAAIESHQPGTAHGVRRRVDRLRRRPWAAAAGVAALGAVLAAFVWLAGGDERSVEAIKVGAGPDGIVAHAGMVWVANSREDTVSRIDIDKGRVTKTIQVGREPDSVAIGSGSVWVTNSRDGTVSRINQSTGSVQAAAIRVGRRPEGITGGFGRIWVVNSLDGTVTEIDPSTNRAAGERIVVGREPRDIDAGEGALWVTNRDGNLLRIDRGSRRPSDEPVMVGGVLRGIVVRPGAVWLANTGGGTIVEIDPAKLDQRGDEIAVGAKPNGLAVTPDAIWVGNTDGTLTEIDPRARETRGEPIRVGERPVGVAVGEGAVWVANNGSGTVTRIALD